MCTRSRKVRPWMARLTRIGNELTLNVCRFSLIRRLWHFHSAFIVNRVSVRSEERHCPAWWRSKAEICGKGTHQQRKRSLNTTGATEPLARSSGFVGDSPIRRSAAAWLFRRQRQLRASAGQTTTPALSQELARSMSRASRGAGSGVPLEIPIAIQ